LHWRSQVPGAHAQTFQYPCAVTEPMVNHNSTPVPLS